MAQAALANTSTFKEAVDSLRQYNEDNRLLFSHHFDVFHQPEVFKDSVEDLDHLEAKCKAAFRGFQSSQGYTAEQLMAATLEIMMAPSLQKQWGQYTCEESEPPTLKILLNFVDRQRKSALDERLSTPKPEKRPKVSLFPHPNKTVLHLQEVSDHLRDKCQCCGEAHKIHTCADFRSLSVADRLSKAKTKRCCYNYLAADHSAIQCPSRGRCRRCRSKHHTLLHKEQLLSDNVPAPSSPREDPPAPASRSVTSASSCAVQSSYLPRTVLALASAGSHSQCCRAQLDTGAMLTLVTRKLANAFHAKGLPGTAITIAGIGGEQQSSHQVEIRLQSLRFS